MTKSYIAMTIQVNVPGDKHDADYVAQEVQRALSTLLRVGTTASVSFALLGDDEANTVNRLLQHVNRS